MHLAASRKHENLPACHAPHFQHVTGLPFSDGTSEDDPLAGCIVSRIALLLHRPAQGVEDLATGRFAREISIGFQARPDGIRETMVFLLCRRDGEA